MSSAATWNNRITANAVNRVRLGRRSRAAVISTLGTPALRPARRIPQGGGRVIVPGSQALHARLELIPIDRSRLHHRFPRALKRFDHDVQERTKGRAAGAGADRQAGAPLGCGTGIMQEIHQTAPDEWIESLTRAPTDITALHRLVSVRFRPETNESVIIVLDDDASTRPNGPGHFRDHLFRTVHLAEHKASVRDVEASPFILRERQLG